MGPQNVEAFERRLVVEHSDVVVVLIPEGLLHLLAEALPRPAGELAEHEGPVSPPGEVHVDFAPPPRAELREGVRHLLLNLRHVI